MKNFNKLIILIALCAMMPSCKDEKQIGDEIIYLKVNGVYPEKEIYVDDIADIKYVQMEFSEDYLFGGWGRSLIYVATTKIVIYDYATNDVLFFSMEGKPLSKFNHHGNGPGEYPTSSGIFYNDKEDRLYLKFGNKFNVYSSEGDFFNLLEIPSNEAINALVDFDEESLLAYRQNDAYNKNIVRISKKDASLIEEIDILDNKDIFLPNMYFSFNFIKYNDGYLLSEHSCDTVFYYGKNKVLEPVLVKTPPIASSDPYYILFSYTEAGDYLFFKRYKVENEKTTFLDNLMMDKNDGSVYKQKILMKDLKEKDNIDMSPLILSGNHDSKVGFVSLTIDELLNAYDEDRLSGKLKDIVETFDEDSNDVFMLLYFK